MEWMWEKELVEGLHHMGWVGEISILSNMKNFIDIPKKNTGWLVGTEGVNRKIVVYLFLFMCMHVLGLWMKLSEHFHSLILTIEDLEIWANYSHMPPFSFITLFSIGNSLSHNLSSVYK